MKEAGCISQDLLETQNPAVRSDCGAIKTQRQEGRTGRDKSSERTLVTDRPVTNTEVQNTRRKRLRTLRSHTGQGKEE